MTQRPTGRYELRYPLASGGMGEVYVADYVAAGQMRRTVALKRLLPSLAEDPKHVRLFLSEARIAALLHHPNVVQVFDAGFDEGRYFLAMEFVDGVALSGLITSARRREKPCDAEVLVHVARQSLDALHYLHTLTDEMGRPLDLVHRDISPANLLVSTRGEVKLSDFGIAKMRDSENYTAPGEVRGKLAYIAPEVLLGASAGPRSDLYALGVTLYRMATLQSPFLGDAPDLISAVRSEKVPLRQRRPDLPEAVCAAVDRAMAREPGDRFSTAAQMREAFPRGDVEARSERLGELVAIAREGAPLAPRPSTAPIHVSEVNVATPHEPPARTALTVLEDSGGRAVVDAKRPRPGVWAAVCVGTGLVVAAAWWAVTRQAEARPTPVVPPSEAPPRVEAPPTPTPTAPTSAAVPPAEAGDAPAPTPEPTTTVRVAPPVKASVKSARLRTPALLSLQAAPWANVEINGKAVGQTPLGSFAVHTPTVVVRLTRPGYRTVERRLRVTAGEVTKINERLEPE